MLVVAGDALTRLGILAHLRLTKTHCVCSDADSARRARELCAAQPQDVIVIDLPMPHGDGAGLLREFACLAPNARTVVIGTLELEVERLFRAGARGFIHREDAPAALGEAFTAVLSGDRFVSHRAEQTHFAALARKSLPARAGRVGRSSDRAKLSDRELAIFELIGNGDGPVRIAEELGISVKTVETHQQRMKEKLDVRTASDLRQRAQRWLATRRGN